MLHWTKCAFVFLIALALSVAAVPQMDGPGSLQGGVWKIEVVDDFEIAGWGSFVALDSLDHPHIVYYTEMNHGVKHANWTGAGWSIETVDCCRHIPWGASIAIDDSDYPHISYSYQHKAGGPSELRYARWDGSAWMNETVDPAIDTGRVSVLALGSDGYPHIAYLKITTFFPQLECDLRYARWDGSKWHLEVIEHVPDWIGEISFTLDSIGHPRISYSSKIEGNYTLKYARWDGSVWITETVDSHGDVGRRNSLALDSNDRPHIAYNDMTNEDLKYASWDGSAWQLEIVDPGGDTGLGFYGWDPSIALDDLDRPHIGYWGNGLRYAWWNVIGWQTEQVDSVGFETLSISFALNSSGYPSMSYNDYVTGELRYAYRTELPPEPSRSITLDIDPDTLNLKSKGRWITAYLSAENASVHDMDVSTILLQDALAPERWDYQDDMLMLKFNRQDFKDTVQVGESVQVKITGKWQDGTAFEAYDSIRVINP